MEQFTIKDFILYNNPCFSCNSNTKSSLIVQNADNDYIVSAFPQQSHAIFNLKISYTSTLKLKIFYTSNKFETSSTEQLTQFLSNNKVFFNSFCHTCLSDIDSQFLEFNTNKFFILPTNISSENLFMISNNKSIALHSSYIENITIVSINEIPPELDPFTSTQYFSSPSPTLLQLPLFPLSKFKTKQNLANKIKTYLNFL